MKKRFWPVAFLAIMFVGFDAEQAKADWMNFDSNAGFSNPNSWNSNTGSSGLTFFEGTQVIETRSTTQSSGTRTVELTTNNVRQPTVSTQFNDSNSFYNRQIIPLNRPIFNKRW